MVEELIYDCMRTCAMYDLRTLSLSSHKETAKWLYGADPDNIWQHRNAQQQLDNHKRLQEWLDK